MKIISKRRIVEAIHDNPQAKTALNNWYGVVNKATWNSFLDVRKTFNNADIYKGCVVFNISGNKYRLIAKIRYRTKRVYIRFIMTHSDYDKNAWKEDCEC